jgi:transcription termination factor Rho
LTIVPQPPLERSVLERKERDELATIAEAMGVKPSARASKSTLIDHILREAGIETAPEEKPRRSRVTKAAAARAANGAEQPALVLDDAGETPTEPAPPEATSGEAAPPAVVDAITESAPGLAGPPNANGSAPVDVRTDTTQDRADDDGSGNDSHPADAGHSGNDAGTRTDDRPRESGARPEHRPGPGGPQPFDANDPANRRGRRRRGRERGEREVVPERGGQAEAQYQG